MELRQAAVLRKAGSYVSSPASSAVALICLRSVARIVPSLIGSSYCFPVRLSVIVSVSAIFVPIGLRIFFWNGLGRHAVVTVDPLGKILELASLAAERLPGR